MTVGLSRSDFAGLPSGAGCARYLYAVEFTDGTVKVGSTRQPRYRAEALRGLAARHGMGVVGLYADSLEGRASFRDELAVVHEITSRHGPAAYGREWFSGIGIAAAMDAIKAAKRSKATA